jgi:hypothetical protein
MQISFKERKRLIQTFWISKKYKEFLRLDIVPHLYHQKIKES